MPIPTPRKLEKRSDFVSRCISSIGDEYEDKDQALAICFSRWRDKKAKAAYVVQAGGEEFIMGRDEKDLKSGV